MKLQPEASATRSPKDSGSATATLTPVELQPIPAIRLLGAIEVSHASHREALPAKEAALLAVLALARSDPVSTDRLVEVLWGGQPPATAANSLQVYVSRLRRLLGRASVRRTGQGYLLDLPVASVDVSRFESLAEEGARLARAGSWERASFLLAEARRVWSAPPLGAGLVDAAWAAPHVARLENAHLGVVEAYAEAELALGRAVGLAAELEELVDRFPFSERLHAARLRALYAAGRRADALAAYEHARVVLRDELGLDPGQELREIHQAILEDRLSNPTSESVEMSSRMLAPPAPTTPLTGRAELLDKLLATLAGPWPRLLTLTGPGGVGKTRMAVEATHVDRLAQMVCWVSLSGLNEPAELMAAVVAAAGLPSSDRSPRDTLVAALHGRQVLLVLDNMEHLLPDAALIVSDLLGATAGLRVLTTSRVPLRIQGEHRFPVPPLRLPEVDATIEQTRQAPAVQLFCARAAAVDPSRNLSDAELAAASRVCAELDGLPLAIELAAARVAHTSVLDLPNQVAGPRPALRGNVVDGEPRHRTLQATISWSVDLLPEYARRTLTRLSVWRGTFDTAAAEAVAPTDGVRLPDGDITQTLEELVDASLLERVVPPPSPGVGPSRYRLLHTVRDNLNQLLDPEELKALESQRAQHLAGRVAVAWGRGLPLYPRTGHDMELLRGFNDDLRAALTWSGLHDPGLHAELAVGTASWWEVTGAASEALGWLEQAAKEGPADRGVDALFWISVLRAHVDPVAARDPLLRCVVAAESLGDVARLASATARLAFLENLNDHEFQARELAGRADRLLEQVAVTDLNADVMALAVSDIACAAIGRDAQKALTGLERAAELAARSGSALPQASIAGNRVEQLVAMGRYADARQAAELALGTIEEWPGVAGFHPYLRSMLAGCRMLLGEPLEETVGLLRQAWAVASWAGRKDVRAEVLAVAAATAARAERRDLATVLAVAHGQAQYELGIPASHVAAETLKLVVPSAIPDEGAEGLGGQVDVEAALRELGVLPGRQS